MKRVLVSVGTRPEGIKMAPVIAALKQSSTLEPVVLSTGQHREMLRQVVELFGFKVDIELDVMQPNQTLASLTARLLTAIDEVMTSVEPDIVLAQGDTTTVLTTALASFYRGIPLGHVEAGLRTGNLQAPFPEEANRVLAGRLTTLHFAPTERSKENLLAEGVDPNRIYVTGNTVIDALHMEIARQSAPAERDRLDALLTPQLFPGWRDARFVLVTGHRRESFGSGFEQICRAIRQLAERHPDVHFIYPVHLNPNVQGPVYELLANVPTIHLMNPLPYSEFMALLNASHLVLTDSGGVQEEAPGLAKPVLVMRETTERPEGVDAGTVKLVGTQVESIVNEVSRLLTDSSAYAAMAQARNPYGDGHASERIAKAVEDFLA